MKPKLTPIPPDAPPPFTIRGAGPATIESPLMRRVRAALDALPDGELVTGQAVADSIGIRNYSSLREAMPRPSLLPYRVHGLAANHRQILYGNFKTAAKARAWVESRKGGPR